MPEVSLAELRSRGVLDFGDGYRTKRSEHGQPGFRILRVADVTDGEVHTTGPDFVSEVYAKAIGSKASQPGDVLLTTKGTVGRVAVYPNSAEQVVYSPQLCYFRVRDETVLHPRLLAYWFRSGAFLEQAAHRANNTDMAAYINLRDIASLSLDLPNADEQRAIVEVLGALDEKSAANAAVIEKADALAATIYEEAASETAPLSSLARFVNGKAFTKGATGTGRVVIRIAELNSGVGGSTVHNDIDVAGDHVARPGDLLFAWSGSLTAVRWFRPEAIINQHIFKVVADKGWPLWLVNQAVQTKLVEFKAIAADKATTMGHIQRHHLDQPTPVPPWGAVGGMDGLMTGLWDAALAAEMERERLAATRDELLPLLLSGRIAVRDAEEAAEAVT